MRYEIQKGIVLTRVCDEFLLVAARPARGICPYVKLINNTGAFFWQLVEEGVSFSEMVDRAVAHYHAPREQIENDLKAFLLELTAQKYIHPEDNHEA